MSSIGTPAFAGGDIYPCRFVKQSAAADFNVLQATANDPIKGISQAGTNLPPIPEVTSDKAAVAGQQLRIHTPPEGCLLELGGTVAAGDRLLEDPAPQAMFKGFGESSLDFVVQAWTNDGYDQAQALTSELGLTVHRLLSEAGIVIPFPQRDLHLTSVSPDARAALSRTDGKA